MRFHACRAEYFIDDEFAARLILLFQARVLKLWPPNIEGCQTKTYSRQKQR